MLSHFLALFSVFEFARAATVTVKQATTILSSVQVESFKPYSIYAAAAYCPPSTTLSWSCGVNCAKNPSFQPYASGGDGSLTQFWYVGWDPTLSSVVIAHQGTDPTQLLADLTDLNFFLQGLDPTLFPGLPSSIKVHEGFANEHAKTAATILAAVLALLKNHNASSVVVTGHSLGAALALLDSVYLSLHLPAGTRVSMVGYGMPRVGNPAFADYVDAMHSASSVMVTVTHFNNKKDPIPVVPGRFLGFAHPAGEVHIQNDSGNSWFSCPGHDNPSQLCSVGDVPNVIQSNILDHLGPYEDGIFMGSC
ncbi:lipase class 3 family protein [Russula emetica]|nr:lipase class 3 family protein [Russula emetica]